MNDAAFPGVNKPPAEHARAQGRGLRILLAIQPLISKKDISDIRRRLASILSDSYSSVELSYYERDTSSTFLKILAEQATFRLYPEEVSEYYSRLLRGFLQRFEEELRKMNYTFLDVQVEFLTRTRPPEKEGEFIALPTAKETSALLALQTAIVKGSLPPLHTPDPEESIAAPPPPERAHPDGPSKEEAPPLPWIERELQDPEERSYREKARQELRERKVGEGIQTCLEGLEKYPDSPYLLYLLGILLSSQGKDNDALTIFDYLITTHADCTEAYIARGRVRRLLGDTAGAEQDFAKAREREPDLVIQE
jgi:tetratricopeptide (TPR) repeat protein